MSRQSRGFKPIVQSKADLDRAFKEMGIKWSDDPDDAGLGLAPARSHEECLERAQAIADRTVAAFLADTEKTERLQHRLDTYDWPGLAHELVEEGRVPVGDRDGTGNRLLKAARVLDASGSPVVVGDTEYD